MSTNIKLHPLTIFLATPLCEILKMEVNFCFNMYYMKLLLIDMIMFSLKM